MLVGCIRHSTEHSITPTSGETPLSHRPKGEIRRHQQARSPPYAIVGRRIAADRRLNAHSRLLWIVDAARGDNVGSLTLRAVCKQLASC